MESQQPAIFRRSEWARIGRGVVFEVEASPSQASQWIELAVGVGYGELLIVGHESRRISEHRYEWHRWERPFVRLAEALLETSMGDRGSQFAICWPAVTKCNEGDTDEDVLPDLGLSGCPIVQWSIPSSSLTVSHLPRIGNLRGEFVDHIEYSNMYKRLKLVARKSGLLR
jgi:hypothetical protein